jgi:hypothetical protein
MTLRRSVFGRSGSSEVAPPPRRWLSVMLVVQVLTGGLAVVAVAGPLASPASAEIRTWLPTERLCSGQPVTVVLPSWTAKSYELFVPANTTVPISVAVDGDLSFAVYAQPENGSRYTMRVDTVHGPSTWNLSYGQGASGDVFFTVSNEFGSNSNVVLTANAGAAAGACSALSSRETTGTNCAVKNASSVQGFVADPVNTATGNFNMPFDDLSIPGRGPALALNHAYNSLQAVADGPHKLRSTAPWASAGPTAMAAT